MKDNKPFEKDEALSGRLRPDWVFHPIPSHSASVIVRASRNEALTSQVDRADGIQAYRSSEQTRQSYQPFEVSILRVLGPVCDNDSHVRAVPIGTPRLRPNHWC